MQGTGPQGPNPPEPTTQFSADGFWWWDGTSWRPAVSPDGLWRWNGQGWIAARSMPVTSRGPGAGWLIGLIAGGLVLLLAVVSVGVYAAVNIWNTSSPSSSFRQPTPVPRSTASVPAAAGIPCEGSEHTQVHFHLVLQILDRGTLVPLPPGTGIIGSPFSPTCWYWLHVHPGTQDVIHIEAPNGHTFTLGDFFSVWSAWSGTNQALDVAHVSTLTVGAGQELLAFVDAADGKGALPFTGDPKSIVLTPHQVITLEISPPTTAPPVFKWPAGL
jgi:hypothetical protein